MCPALENDDGIAWQIWRDNKMFTLSDGFPATFRCCCFLPLLRVDSNISHLRLDCYSRCSVAFPHSVSHWNWNAFAKSWGFNDSVQCVFGRRSRAMLKCFVVRRSRAESIRVNGYEGEKIKNRNIAPSAVWQIKYELSPTANGEQVQT